jgi:hypothetical protein
MPSQYDQRHVPNLGQGQRHQTLSNAITWLWDWVRWYQCTTPASQLALNKVQWQTTTA